MHQQEQICQVFLSLFLVQFAFCQLDHLLVFVAEGELSPETADRDATREENAGYPGANIEKVRFRIPAFEGREEAIPLLDNMVPLVRSAFDFIKISF